LRRHLHFTQKGAGFDSACIDHEVTVHETVFGPLNTIESNANNAQLEARAKKATPVIQSHSTEAHSIQTQLTSAI